MTSRVKFPAFAHIVLFSGLALVSSSVLAHHPMDGAVPETAINGLLSGLAHPIIGLDHFVFLIAAALLAAWTGMRSVRVLGLFAVASLAGTWAHSVGWTAPLLEVGVGVTLLILAGLLLAKPAIPKSAWFALAALAGGFHGHAFGEAIIGAEATPLLAYLAGLLVIQAVVLVMANRLGRWLLNTSSRSVVPARWVVACVAGLVGALASSSVLFN